MRKPLIKNSFLLFLLLCSIYSSLISFNNDGSTSNNQIQEYFYREPFFNDGTINNTRDLWIEGDLAYVAGYNYGLRIIDISDKANPQIIGEYKTSDDAHSVVVRDGLAYIADGYYGIEIVNVSDPYNPTYVSDLDSTDRCRKVRISGNYAYMSDGFNGLRVVNITNPLSMGYLDSYDTWVADGMAIVGDLVYLADWYDGFYIINVSNPNSLSLVYNIDTPDFGYNVIINGSIAYIHCGPGGIEVYNITNPSSPNWLSNIDTGGIPSDSVIKNNLLYTADNDFDLVITNMSNLASPDVLSTFGTDGSGFIEGSGDFLYITGFDKFCLEIIDISNPLNPLFVSKLYNNGSYLKGTPSWSLSPFVIDDDGGGDYTWAQAVLEEWCKGSGTWSDPYIIENVIVDGLNMGSCITIRDSNAYFIIENCTLYNSNTGLYPNENAGIKLYNANNGLLLENNCSNNNGYGIYLYTNCQNNTIIGNLLQNNGYDGIRLRGCIENKIINNTAQYNSLIGICLEINSNNNYVFNNSVEHQGLLGIKLYESDNCTILQNFVNISIFQGIILQSNSDYNRVLRNEVYNLNSHGIDIDGGFSNNITGNYIHNCSLSGISLRSNSDSTNIINNKILNCTENGIKIDSGCDNNNIIQNFLYNNDINAYDNGVNNNWNNSTIGNFWDDYMGVDANDDGIGDTPYNISGPADSQDFYPIWDDGEDKPPSVIINAPLATNYSYSGIIINATIIDALSSIDNVLAEIDNILNLSLVLTGSNIYINDTYEFSDGSHIIRIFAYDSLGNLNSTETINFTVDLSAPGIIIVTPFNQTVSNHAPTINAVYSDIHYDSLWYEFENVNYTLSNNTGQQLNTIIWNALPQGTYFVYVYANDTFGNLNDTMILTLCKDTQAPRIDIITPLNESSSTYAPILNIQYSDLNYDSLWFEFLNVNYTLSNGTNIQINPEAWNTLLEGNYYLIYIYANDTVGNINSTIILRLYKDFLALDDDDDNQEPSTNYSMPIIIIIIIIIGAAVMSPLMIKKMSATSKKSDKLKIRTILEGTPDPFSIEEILRKKHDPLSKPSKIMKKKKSFEDLPVPLELSDEEKAELAKTEEEVKVEERKILCLVHRGPIQGSDVFICPNCQIFYCERCAKVLKLKDEPCWICGSELSIRVTEQDRITLLEKRSIEILEDIIKETPRFMEFIMSEKLIEESPEIHQLIFSLIPPEDLNKIDLLNLDISQKKKFIKEYLNLDLSKRESFLNELLKKQ